MGKKYPVTLTLQLLLLKCIEAAETVIAKAGFES